MLLETAPVTFCPKQNLAAALQALPGRVGRLPPTGQRSGLQPPFPQLVYLETHPTYTYVRDVAEQWGKAVMLALNGLNITPVRPFWMCSVCHPDHRPAKCPFQHCKQEKCRGNAILRSADGSSYSILIPHHKTSANSK